MSAPSSDVAAASFPATPELVGVAFPFFSFSDFAGAVAAFVFPPLSDLARLSVDAVKSSFRINDGGVEVGNKAGDID